jgi:hypothetical protein
MRNIRQITEILVSTRSTEPLRGTFEIGTQDSMITFELTEDMAHSICTSLEHFLTQKQGRKPANCRYG